MKNTGKAYEQLTEEVFKRLLAHGGQVCANVRRDIILQGKSTKHQIDVYFDFIAGPALYQTLVQCKDWGVPVKQEQLLAFHDVLNDIPGQPRGIMVSRSGFQEGAHNVARHHGIELYELREPRDEDWTGLLRSIQIRMILQLPHFEIRHVIDEEWARAEATRLGIPRGTRVDINPNEAKLVFESGEVCDLRTILAPYVPHQGAAKQVQHRLEPPAFLEAPDCPLPRLLVRSVEATITCTAVERLIEVGIDHMVAYCFRNVLSGDIRFLGHDGGPLKA